MSGSQPQPSGNLDALNVKFTHSNTVRDKKPYTIYEIEVRSSSTITWVIYKRYNDFHALHQALTKFKSTPAQQHKNIALPTLPPKRLTRSLAAEFVEKRKQELQEYLRDILATPALRHADIVLSFLEVPDSVRPMLSRAKADAAPLLENKDGEAAPPESALNARNFQHKSFEERKVLELVQTLTYHRNKVAAIKTFEEWFFEFKPRLTAPVISMLLQAAHGGEKECGLIQTCGDFQYSHVASRAALDLLCRLLDVEKNKDAQLFLESFTSLQEHVLRRMNLHLHILSERGNRLGAFMLVSLLRPKMLELATAANHNPNKPKSELSLEKIVADNWARQEYFRWADRKNEMVSHPVTEPMENSMRSLNLADMGAKKIAEQAFQEILSLAQNTDPGWRPARTTRSKSVADAKDLDSSSMRLVYKPDPRRDVVAVRLSAVLPFSADDVTKLILDLTRRKEWDVTFHRGKRVEKIDATSDVVHYVFKSFSSPYKYRDFCLLRAWNKLQIGGRIIATRSVTHPKVPEMKDNIRAVLYATGYIITPLEDETSGSSVAGSTGDNNKGCLLTFVAQMDRESVLILSPDLLGETNQLGQSVENLKALLRQQEKGTSGPPMLSSQSSLNALSP